MKIEIVVDPSRPVPAASLVSRVAPAAPAPQGGAPRLVRTFKLSQAPVRREDANSYAVFNNAGVEGLGEEDVAEAGGGPNDPLRRLLTLTRRWR